MNLLTEDMNEAIKNANLPESDEKIISDILYQERINKERAWDSDAEKSIIKIIDDSFKEDMQT